MERMSFTFAIFLCVLVSSNFLFFNFFIYICMQQMSSEERLPFQQKAKGDKLNMSEERYTTQGVSYTTLDKIENDKITKEMAMQERINQLLNHHSIPDGKRNFCAFFMD